MTTPSVMLDRCEGLIGTQDLDDRETEFIEGLVARRASLTLSAPQLDWLTRIHDRNFAG